MKWLAWVYIFQGFGFLCFSFSFFHWWKRLLIKNGSSVFIPSDIDSVISRDAEKPELLPLKKRATAGKSLVGYNIAPESDSSSDSSDEGDVACLPEKEVNKETLQELQKNAFYSLLQAFALETSTMSNVTVTFFLVKSFFRLLNSFCFWGFWPCLLLSRRGLRS